MARITNNTDTSLNIGGVVIGAGRTAEVERWHIVQRMPQAKALIAAKAISEVPKEPEPKAEPKRAKAKAPVKSEPQKNDDTDA